MTPVGRRILINGATGSGKTTLAQRLGALLGIGVVELDALYHQPNWTPTPPDQFLEKVRAAIDSHPEGWVVAGNYSQVRPYLLSQADTAIWLRLPWRVSYSRMLWRTLRRAWTKEELWNGNRESWRLSFASKDSLLLWGIHHHRATLRKTRQALYETDHNARVIELRSAREVRLLLASVEAACESSAAVRRSMIRRE
jgi:adenylate kinase family enzyme